jgi:hypothetical protein
MPTRLGRFLLTGDDVDTGRFRIRGLALDGTRHAPRNAEPAGPYLVLGPGGQASLMQAPAVAVEPPPPTPSDRQEQTRPVSPALSRAALQQSSLPEASSQPTSPAMMPARTETPIQLQTTPERSPAQTILSAPQSIQSPLSNLAAAPSSGLVSTTGNPTQIVVLPSGSLTLASVPPSSVTFLFPSASPGVTSSIASPPTTSSDNTSASSFPTSAPKTLTSNHSASFYVGIVFAVIAAIAVAMAIITWWIRVRRHRRRHDATAIRVPWAGRTDDGLEEARPSTSFLGRAPILAAFRHDDSNWEFVGDRDVGVPKTEPSLPDVHLPTTRAWVDTGPFSHPSAPAVSSNDFFAADPPVHGSLGNSLCPPSDQTTVTRIPSSDESVQDHHSASTLGPLQVANLMPGDRASSYDTSSRPSTGLIGTTEGRMNSDFGTPREDFPGSRPRFMGLDGQGLTVPWAPLQTRASHRKTEHWDHLPPLPFPDEMQSGTAGRQRSDGWSDSLKANLVNAFNAVAGNLAGTVPHMEQDPLTRIPPRPKRRLKRADGFESETMRGSTDLSMSSSKAWTLEETREGAGVVHLHVLQSDDSKCSGFLRASQDALGLHGSDTYNLSLIDSYGSSAALIPTRKPPNAVTKVRQFSGLFGRRESNRGGNPSRASSVYSAASAASNRFGYNASNFSLAVPSFSRRNTRMRSRRGTKLLASDAGSVNGRTRIPRPEAMTRVSSSGCSATSFRSELSGVTEWTDNEERAKAALRERRMDTGRRGREED